MLLFIEPSQIYVNPLGESVSAAARCAACHTYTTGKLVPKIVAAAYRQVSEYLSQEASEAVAGDDLRQFRTPFDSRTFEIDVVQKKTRVKKEREVLECYHRIFDRKNFDCDLISQTIETITRRAVAECQSLELPGGIIEECFSRTESLLNKYPWEYQGGFVPLDKYLDAGVHRQNTGDFRLFIEKEALVTRIAKYLGLKFQAKIQKVNRIVFFRRARFIRQHIPREVISAGMSGNGFHLHFEDLGTVWQNLAQVLEIRLKAPSLLFMYLHHLDRLQNFFAFSDDENSRRRYGEQAIEDASRMRLALAETGMAGLKTKVFPLARAGDAPAAANGESAPTSWNAYPLSKKLWRTLVKLPSSRWTQLIYERCYGDAKKFARILEILADAEKTPKLSHFKWYLNLIFDAGELSEFEKLWIYRAVLKQPARRRLNAAQFSRELLRIRDFVRFTHPKPDSNQTRAGWTWLAAASDLWHETTLRDSGEETDYQWISPVRIFAADKFLGVALTSAQALVRESNLMHHCVRNYAPAAAQGKSTLFHLVSFPNQKTCEEKLGILSALTAADDWQGIYDIFENITTRNQATTEFSNTKLAENKSKSPRHNFRVMQVKGFCDRAAAEFAPFAGTLKNHFAAEFNRAKDATETEFSAQVRVWVEGQPEIAAGSDQFDSDIPF